jgi:hypothetical protein
MWPKFAMSEEHSVRERANRMKEEVLLIGMFITDPLPEFFHPGSRAKNSKRHRILNLDLQKN